MRLSSGVVGLALAACTPSEVRVRSAPAQAVSALEARLVERGIEVDPAGRGPDRVRTRFFCHQPPGVEGREWERSFAHPAPGPLPLTVDGDTAAQERARARCPHLFRVDVFARPAEGGPEAGSRVVVTSEWWRLRSAGCEPVGDPLLAEQRCHYRYAGARAPSAVEPYVYGLLSGL